MRRSGQHLWRWRNSRLRLAAATADRVERDQQGKGGHMIVDRRALMSGLAAGSLFGGVALAQRARDLGPNRLVLLGNKGGPSIRAYAPSPSANLLVWNNVPYVIDAG